MKKNNKGFTLVELIVVLVILAILAAILVPALLGYIDKARNSQYLEEAHSILTAAQAYETEQYAKGEDVVLNFTSDANALNYVNAIVSPTDVTALVVESSTVTGSSSMGSKHAEFTVGAITQLEFTSQNGKNVSITRGDDGTWSDPVELP